MKIWAERECQIVCSILFDLFWCMTKSGQTVEGVRRDHPKYPSSLFPCYISLYIYTCFVLVFLFGYIPPKMKGGPENDMTIWTLTFFMELLHFFLWAFLLPQTTCVLTQQNVSLAEFVKIVCASVSLFLYPLCCFFENRVCLLSHK